MTASVLLSLVFGFGWLPLLVFRTEAPAAAMPHYAGRERFWVLAAPALIALHVTASCITLSITAAVPLWRGGLAVALYLSGLSFWIWARASIGPMRRPRLPDEPPARLRRDGPFGLVRNPLYLGVLVMASAPVIAGACVLLLPSLALCFAALAVRAAQEERRLHEQLGPEYADYCGQVKRLIPFVW